MICTIELPRSVQLRIGRTGCALFWGDFNNRRTFQIHWAGFAPGIVWGDIFNRRRWPR